MSHPSKDKLERVQKEFVDQLDEFLNITMSDVQVKQWTMAIAKYDIDVLRAGWDEFLYKVRPGLMPSISDALEIIKIKDDEYRRMNHNEIKKEDPRREKSDPDFCKFMDALTYGLRQKSSGRWTEGQRLEHMKNTFKNLGMMSDANDLQIQLDRWKRKNIDDTQSPI